MKIKSIILASITIVILALVACKKEEDIVIVEKDIEAPTITNISPPKCSEHLWGTEVHLKAAFGDDRDLKNYEVYVCDANYTVDSSFNFNPKGEICGKEFQFHEDFIVPDSAYVWRYFILRVTDRSGKTAQEMYILHFAEN